MSYLAYWGIPVSIGAFLWAKDAVTRWWDGPRRAADNALDPTRLGDLEFYAPKPRQDEP